MSKALEKKYNKGVFIFHRDLRITDNIGLYELCQKCEKVYTLFIFTPEQVTDINKYKSNNSVQFMIESLKDLYDEIKHTDGELITLFGNYNRMIMYIIDIIKPECIGFNKDYTSYAINRELKTTETCKKNNIDVIVSQDYYLYEPGTVKTGSGDFYKKFTPFYTTVLPIHVKQPVKKTTSNKFAIFHDKHKFMNYITLNDSLKKFVKNTGYNNMVIGGRKNGIIQLKNTIKTQKKYDKLRDILNINTSLLSAYIKFGCISIREVYYIFKNNFGRGSELLRQLIWREFYAHILYGYPHVIGHSFNKKYDDLEWVKNKKFLKAWQEGKTGFPIVDACMRQLNQTGWMHNRGRLITASFLVKDLLIDWQDGEQYFATKLTDYDVASNNGNWQWVAGTGVDSMPYFRIFNPWLQSEKFDKDAEFIKKWVPELKDVEIKDIHEWYDACIDDKYKHVKYPKPIVNITEQKTKILDIYKNA